MAVQFGSARTANDPVELAGRYFDFVNKKSADKPKAPRRKLMSEAE
jgi:hypothetical protein